MPVFNKMVYNGTEYILGGGANIGEPLNLTVTTIGLDATITWEDNEIGTIPPTTFQKSELVRKIGSAPTSPSDGDLVVTETVKDTYKVSGYVDSGLTDGETYYYRVFSYSDLGGISYCDAVSVTVSSSWQPGANTVAYYPLDSTNTVNDLSGNNHTLTNISTVFGTYNGVSCAYFNGSNSYLYNNSITTSAMTDDFTLSLYVNQKTIGDRGITSNITGNYYGYNLGTDGSGCPKIEIMDGNGATTNSNYPTSVDTWYHVVCTHDSSNNTKIYINGNLENSGTKSFGDQNISKFIIGAYRFYNDANPGGYFDGNVSNFILENKCWTAQEISDYYDQTKGDYGIS